MIIYVDIDNTICKTNDMDYKNSIPLYDNIKKINELYKKGNRIIYWTARGVGSGIDYSQLTKQQLTNWNCLYDELRLDKPLYDLFIDDKNVNSNEYFKIK